MSTVQVYGPWADTGLEALVRGFCAPTQSLKDAPAAIRVDVAEVGNAYVVHAEIPGVTKDDIHVTIENDQVTIAAEIKRAVEAKDGQRVLRSERYAGSVFRSFRLPSELDEAASEAKYEGGVLELKLAKKAPVAGRKLAIQ